MDTTEEIWKPVEGFENYHVSTLGRIKNVKKGNILSPVTRRCGYKNVLLYAQDGINKKYNFHRLIATLHIPNPKNLPQVDHINRDRGDNRVSNLRWVSLSEQARNKKKFVTNPKHLKAVWKCDKDTGKRIKLFTSAQEAVKEVSPTSRRSVISGCASGARKTAFGYKWEYSYLEAIEGEIWKPLPASLMNQTEENVKNYFISDHGRLKDPTGHIRLPTSHPEGYVHFCIKYQDYMAHRLVAMTFLEPIPGKDIVNHKNGDRTDCVLSNLEFVDHAENMRHAVEIGLIKSNPVKQYRLNGEFVKEHASPPLAATSVKTTGGRIYYAAKVHNICEGFQWRFSHDDSKGFLWERIESKKRKREDDDDS